MERRCSWLHRSPWALRPSPARSWGVTDGDTITVLVAQRPVKVRLAEIDAPERGQPWGAQAKKALSDKIFGQVVEVRVVDTDRYGRTVGHVHLKGRDINREMVQEGCLGLPEVPARREPAGG